MPSSSNNSRSRGATTTRIKRSSLVLFVDRQAHDMSNLCLNQQAPSLYPERAATEKLAEMDEQYILQLWQHLPIVLVAAPVRPPSSASNGISFQDNTPTSLSASPLLSVQLHHGHPRPPPPATQTSSRRSSLPATLSTPPPANNSVLRQATARPKLDYRRIYSSGDSETSTRRSVAPGSGKHISFQEQQLRRMLDEERKIHEVDVDVDVDVDVQVAVVPIPALAPAALEPSYPMPLPLENALFSTSPPPVEPSYPMPSPMELVPPSSSRQQVAPRLVKQQQSDSRDVKRIIRNPFRHEKESLEIMEKAYHHARSSRSPTPLPTIRCTAGATCESIMEISPNLFVPYRGSQETWEAVQVGRFTVTTCFACSIQLVVIDSVEFLVCPDCQTVSPLCFSDVNDLVERSGVGLGIKREWCDPQGDLGAMEEQPAPPDDDDELILPQTDATTAK
jgi:hypothetical protein